MFRKIFLYVAMLFVFPRRLADAVNRAVSSEELDELMRVSE